MSILFEKLKSLKISSVESDLASAQLAQGENIYTFKKMIFSPKSGLLILGAIIVFALISYYSLFFLKKMLDTSSKNAIVVQHQNVDPIPGIDMMDPANDFSGRPPGSDDALSGYDPADKVSPKKQEEFKVPEFFVIKAKTASEPFPNNLDQLPSPSEPSNMVTKKSVQPHYTTQSIYEIIEKKTQQFDHLKPFNAAKSDTSKRLQLIKSITLPGKNKTSVIDPERSSAQALIKENLKEKEQSAQLEIARRAKEKQTRKISVIAGLAADLEDAVETKDDFRTAQLIQQLEEAADKSSSYGLKLKAFQMIQAKNYDQAKIWLNRVLEKDDTDLEAGLNMAIIELKEGALKDARKRLLQLNDRYPSNRTIDQLLNLL